eukprot:TRINITY_DN47260_c0_g1_i1.p1 TRINITY_DN47260_c0_g1~~TRINITY_DN47260_c0_g1_i1.p1  ORF type:complete len:273 (-),score=78.99 TRINITY_DN47260_c0_g1_i1:125-943(-)
MAFPMDWLPLVRIFAACSLAVLTFCCVDAAIAASSQQQGALFHMDRKESNELPAVAPGLSLLQKSVQTTQLRGAVLEEHPGVSQLATDAEHKAAAWMTEIVNDEPGKIVIKSETDGMGLLYQLLCQLGLGVLYWLIIASKYPVLPEGAVANEEAEKIMRQGEISATCQASSANCFHALCCYGPRGAQTLHSTGVLNFWPALFLLSLFPCCTLCCAHYNTDLPEKLGGQKKDLCMSCLCGFCCSCCMLTQDAEALDKITGARPSFCSVQLAEA